MPPVVIGNKDSDRLETVRSYEHSDPLYYDILNRPLVDLRERTNDLDYILTPGRGIRVRNTIAVSTSVEIETGWFISGAGVPTEYAGSTLGPIAGAAAGLRRIDLIYFNPETGAIVHVAGTEVANTNAWATIFADPTPLKGNIPANDGAIPLAYLYVDDSGHNYDETILIDNPGHIRDARVAPGARRRIFEAQAGIFAVDSLAGAVGTSELEARGDHRHPLNVHDTLGQPVDADSSATSPGPGTSNYYSRSDHRHSPNLLPGANLLKDTNVGAVGSSAALVKADHQHPINVDAALPQTCSPLLGASQSVGGSDFYSRFDHTHNITDVRLAAGSFTLSWAASIAAQTTGAIGYQPYWALCITANYTGPFPEEGGLAFGFVQWTGGTTVKTAGTGFVENRLGGTVNWSATARQYDPTHVLGTGATGHRPVGHGESAVSVAAPYAVGFTDDWRDARGSNDGAALYLTKFDSAGITFQPQAGGLGTFTGDLFILALTLI
jgi:hypothetical protein